GKKGAALAVAVGDELAAHPMRTVQQLEGEIAADGAAQQLGHDRFILRRRLHREAPEPAPIDRGEQPPDALRPDQAAEPRLAEGAIEDREQLGRIEEDVEIVLNTRQTIEADAEGLAYRRRRAVAADDVSRGDVALRASDEIDHLRLDAVRGLAEAFEPRAVMQREIRLAARVRQKDRIEPELRDETIGRRREEARLLVEESREIEPRDLIARHRRRPIHIGMEFFRVTGAAYFIGQPPAAH